MKTKAHKQHILRNIALLNVNPLNLSAKSQRLRRGTPGAHGRSRADAELMRQVELRRIIEEYKDTSVRHPDPKIASYYADRAAALSQHLRLVPTKPSRPRHPRFEFSERCFIVASGKDRRGVAYHRMANGQIVRAL